MFVCKLFEYFNRLVLPQPEKDINQINNRNSQQQDLTEQRIHEIFRELNRLQTEQTGLLQELQDLTDNTDPPGIEWIYPDRNPETQHSR